MSWLAVAVYAAAAAALIAGLRARHDHVIRARLGRTARRRRARESVLVWIGRRPALRGSHRALESLLRRASLEPVVADHLMGTKVVMCLSGGVIGLLAWPAGWVPAGCAALTLAWAGFRIPEFRLARRVAARRRAVADEVPSLLDLLAVCVTAGLSPSVALERAVETTRGPLHEALARARREVALGRSWKGAVRDVAERLDVRDLRRLALTLERGQRLGAPLAEQLRRLARTVRHERMSLAEERARRAPVLMLFPLVFLILPAFVLAAVIPAVIVAAREIP